MKVIKKLAIAGVVCSTLFFGSCKDDSVDPTPTKTCRVSETMDDDGSKTTYTWDGSNLVELSNTDSFGSFKYVYTYESGKLAQISSSSDGSVGDVYKLVYTGSQVTRVDVYDGADVWEYYNISYNTDGTIKMVDNFVVEDPSDVLYSSYEYTYTSGKLTKVYMIQDADDDGVLDKDVDDVSTITVSATDGKTNPLYGLPTIYTDFSDIFSLLKDNMNGGIIEFGGIPIGVSATYEYNSDNLPTKRTATVFGETTVTSFSYKCE
ncbi:MAG: hypothetical protein H6607_03610 [Flavobacteriales bacterium]|nr:hypothetical protein [Flavobacteriales bacterium]